MKSLNLTENLYTYLLDHCPVVDPNLADLAVATLDVPFSQMQISPDQGSLLNFLVKMVNAKKIIEIGCFTGYSAICMAKALPEDGKLVTLDIDSETTKLAKKYFDKVGVSDRIDLRIGDATDSLKKLQEEWGDSSTDMIFVDADKENYDHYYEVGISMLRPGGLMVLDNVLWSGEVINAENQHPSTVALRRINQKIKDDQRVDRVMLSTADGLYLCLKK